MNPKPINECKSYDEMVQSVRERIDRWIDSKEKRAAENTEYWRGFLRGMDEFIAMVRREGTLQVRR